LTIEMREFISNSERKLIKADGDPAEIFEKTPISMFHVIKLTSETGYDIQGGIHKAILQKKSLLKKTNPDAVRKYFEEIITSAHAGKGLKMLEGTGLTRFIIGDLDNRLTNQDADKIATLAENIDKTKQVRLRRLGLFYLCFKKKDAHSALDVLNYDAETKMILKGAIDMIEKINFLANTYEIKQFIKKHGIDLYDYLHNLSKARRIVYDLDDAKIKSRHYLMEYMLERGEPIFLEDLNIDKGDLIAREIVDEEKAEEMLSMLLDVVHQDPGKNSKRALILHAEQFAKNPVQAAFRKVRWIR